MHANPARANLYTLYNHPCGFFARVDANWYQQVSDDYIFGAKLSEPDSSGLAHPIVSKRNAGPPGDDFGSSMCSRVTAFTATNARSVAAC
jgi:hypothetical protein